MRIALPVSALVVTVLATMLATMLAPPMRTGAQAPALLIVEVAGLRNDVGALRGALYDQADRWLDTAHPAARREGAIHGGRARCVFRSPPLDHVAFAGLHDEDGDGEMDRDLLGIPSEGYAFSNDVRPSLSAPSFESAIIPAGRPAAVSTRTTVFEGRSHA